MNDYWHIPRASLVPSSASSSVSSSNRSNKSNSNPPTMAKHSGKQHQRQQLNNNLTAIHGNATNTNNNNNTNRNIKGQNRHQNELSQNLDLTTTKRGSRSSQGSSESNNSTRSAASGSLLLTAANLERFAEIHRKQQHSKFYLDDSNAVPTTNNKLTAYNANLVHGQGMNDTVLTINDDQNLNFVKSKDLDAVSIASSMHFTMVNGEGGSTKKPKRGLCDRGRQVTVLIVSMSTVFMLLIMGMVYALEIRAREMPQS